MTSEWLGLTLTREAKVRKKNGKVVTKTIETTDKWAIAYAAKKFGVPKEDIELVRDNSIIKVRPISDEYEVDFMSLEQFTYELYGFPSTDDEYYQTYEQFGYSNWLIKKYPNVWGTGEYDRLMFDLRTDYHWYRLAEYLDDDLEAVGAVLSDFLEGSYIVLPKPAIDAVLPLNGPCFELGILIWEEESSNFVLFLDEEGDMWPMVVKPDMIEITEDEFEGFEDA